MFIIIFVSLFYKHRNKEESKTEQLRHQLLVAVTLSVMFGLTWAIGLPATQSISGATKPIRDTFASIFVILTAFQGLFVFLLHCLKSSDVRELWRGWFKFAANRSLKMKGRFISSSNPGSNSLDRNKNIYDNGIETLEKQPWPDSTNSLQKLVSKEDQAFKMKVIRFNDSDSLQKLVSKESKAKVIASNSDSDSLQKSISKEDKALKMKVIASNSDSDSLQSKDDKALKMKVIAYNSDSDSLQSKEDKALKMKVIASNSDSDSLQSKEDKAFKNESY